MISVPTYKQLQTCVSEQLGVKPSSVKTCWIAQVKRDLGLVGQRAPNAGRGQGAPPCPPRYRLAIERVHRKRQTVNFPTLEGLRATVL